MHDVQLSVFSLRYNLKNPQTALWVPGIQQNELQLLGTGIREFLTTSTLLVLYIYI